jgi:hypothetical protein
MKNAIRVEDCSARALASWAAVLKEVMHAPLGVGLFRVETWHLRNEQVKQIMIHNQLTPASGQFPHE